MEDYYYVLEENLYDDKDYELYEKFEELNGKYDDYVLYHCNKCNGDDFVFNLNDDKSCTHCDGTKEDIYLIDDIEKYKELCLDEIIRDNIDYCCDNCGSVYNLREYILNNLKCPKCHKIINRKITLKEAFENDEEEYEYYCENCSNNFTSYLSENAKCPECHKKCDSPIETDYEMDYEPTEEEWEDIQFSDD